MRGLLLPGSIVHRKKVGGDQAMMVLTAESAQVFFATHSYGNED